MPENLTYPQEAFGLPVDAAAQVARAAAGLAVAYSENARDAFGNADAGELVYMVAAGLPFIEAVRWNQPQDREGLAEYLTAAKEVAADLRARTESMPSLFGPLDVVIELVLGDDVTVDTFDQKVRDALDAPKTKKAAQATLDYLDKLAAFDSPGDKLRDEFRLVLARFAETDGGKITARDVASNIKAVLEEIAQQQPDGTSKLELLQLFARPLAGIALNGITEHPIKSAEKIKVAAPMFATEIAKAVDVAQPRVRKSIGGVIARAPLLRKRTAAKLAPAAENIGPLINGFVELMFADQTATLAARKQVEELFLPS